MEKNTFYTKTLINYCKCKLLYNTSALVPEKGEFEDVKYSMLIPDTNNIANFTIKYSEDNNDSERILSINVENKEENKSISDTLLAGTNQEIVKYLKSEKNVDDISDKIFSLFKKINGYSIS